MKRLYFVLAIVGLLMACGGSEDTADKAAKAAKDQQIIAQQAQSGLPAETK